MYSANLRIKQEKQFAETVFNNVLSTYVILEKYLGAWKEEQIKTSLKVPSVVTNINENVYYVGNGKDLSFTISTSNSFIKVYDVKNQTEVVYNYVTGLSTYFTITQTLTTSTITFKYPPDLNDYILVVQQQNVNPEPEI